MPAGTALAGTEEFPIFTPSTHKNAWPDTGNYLYPIASVYSTNSTQYKGMNLTYPVFGFDNWD